jgi:hypothetical protein
MTDHIEHTTGSTRMPDSIKVRIPNGRDTSIGDNPIHVDADVLYDAIDLLQVLVLTLDPLKGDDDTDLGASYRLRIATRRITTRLEAAVLADWDTDDGEPCRAYIAELAGSTRRHASPGRTHHGRL